MCEYSFLTAKQADFFILVVVFDDEVLAVDEGKTTYDSIFRQVHLNHQTSSIISIIRVSNIQISIAERRRALPSRQYTIKCRIRGLLEIFTQIFGDRIWAEYACKIYNNSICAVVNKCLRRSVLFLSPILRSSQPTSCKYCHQNVKLAMG